LGIQVGLNTQINQIGVANQSWVASYFNLNKNLSLNSKAHTKLVQLNQVIELEWLLNFIKSNAESFETLKTQMIKLNKTQMIKTHDKSNDW